MRVFQLMAPLLSRRVLLSTLGHTALGLAVLPRAALAAPTLGTPASVVTQPPRAWGPRAGPEVLPDPDILVLDKALQPLLVETALLEQVWTGATWLEGPAWSSMGRYLVLSDTRANRQHRYLWENGAVSTFREPSSHANGNAFDFQGRHVVCEHLERRVIRFEHDGSVRVLADHFESRPLNSPNDVIAHPDGSLWFTDPAYGTTLAEGQPDEAGGPTNPEGRLNPRLGIDMPQLVLAGRRQPAGVYRWDPSGRLDQVLDEAALPSPNGLAFSPDYKRLYVSSCGARTPGQPPPPAGDKAIHVFELDGTRLGKGRVLFDMVLDGVPCGPDGFKVDVSGNLWCAASGPLGYAGVVVVSAAGKPLGRLRLPEVCSNVCFGGPRRNMLFMTATRSLYRLQVDTQGAAPC